MEEQERKEVEKLLYNLTDLQVRASILASQYAKSDDLTDASSINLEDDSDLASEAMSIGEEFSIINDKLSKKLGNKAIEKTMNKIAQCNIYDKELVAYYLDQLVKDMREVSSKTKSIINTEGIKQQFQEKLEKQRREEDFKKQQAQEKEEQQKREEQMKAEQEQLNQEKLANKESQKENDLSGN